MRLYNTLTRREEIFTPSRGQLVRMYTCGLTVYARGHIGNFRTFVALDVLRRALKYEESYEVQQIMNFTDVDDRTIAASRTAEMSLRDYTKQYIEAFREDALTLGLELAEEQPRATDEANLRAMTEMIQALEANGHTYRRAGSIYFKISTLPQYGQLAQLDPEGIKSGARVDSDQYDKENARDFVLWKSAKPEEPSWDFGIGPGRPGWHIECSAMALRLLDGSPIDIHAGGVDLIFPHHENEIAQSEGMTGEQFSRYWVHVEHLLLDQGEKMSKSVGNVLTVPEILEKGYRASVLRYVLLSVHYRKQLKFTWQSMEQADESLARLVDCLGRLDRIVSTGRHPGMSKQTASARAGFSAMIADDLNIPGGLGVIFEFVRAINVAVDQDELGTGNVEEIRDAFKQFDRVLGFISLRQAEDTAPPVSVKEIEQLIADRKSLRKQRDFAAADQIRTDLDARGILLEDDSTGTRWKRK